MKDKTKSSKGAGIETDQAEQLKALLNQSTKVLCKNCDTEETDSSTTSKQDNKSLSPFERKNTQTEKIMVKKRDTNLIASRKQL